MATIGQTMASSWTMKSITTVRSLIALASAMTLSRSAGSSQRSATQPMASDSLTKSGTRVPLRGAMDSPSWEPTVS